ncbi:MAG: class I SAM-dependent methyltransferase [Candidatus Thorarchaeota archaeon]
MNSEERQKILANYKHIFDNEKEYYAKNITSSSRDYDLESGSFFRKANIKFKEILGDVKNKKILDVGCGIGSLSFYLAKRGANVVGIDLSKNLIEFCKMEAKKKELTIEFKEMNAQIPEFEDESFDIIVGFRVVHHLPNIELFFKECKRILKQKGYIAFIEPLKKNLIVELNRKIFAPHKRTIHEHPLFISNVLLAKSVFGNIEHNEFFLLSPVAMFFRDFVKIATLYKALYKVLNIIEVPLTKIKFLKQYCWQTVFKSIKF